MKLSTQPYSQEKYLTENLVKKDVSEKIEDAFDLAVLKVPMPII